MRRLPLLIQRIIGVYRADSGVRGYLRPDNGCALRALTHRGLRVNPEWAAMVDEFAVPIVLTHLDRIPTPVRRATGHLRPCVLASCRAGPVVLLGPVDLERIGGRVEWFVHDLHRAALHTGLSWTLGMQDSSPARRSVS